MLVKENTIISKYRGLYELQESNIGIPIFQRYYDWKEKETKQLKDDLLNALNDSNCQLYLLDFIYYKEDGFIKLADGQQRIVTINILIKAINDVAMDEAIKIDEIKSFNISYDVFSNNDKYEKFCNGTIIKPFKIVYLDFLKFIRENKEHINDFISIIKNRIYIYMKKCENADDAFNIFQQINTGGKPLTKDEVIKTALDQYSKAYNVNLETTKMREVQQSIISYYKFKKSDLNKNFDNMEIITFLKEYITKDKDSFVDFVNTMILLKSIGNNPIKYVINFTGRTTLLDLLNILAMKNIDISFNDSYLKDVLIPMCMMSIVLSMNGGSPTTYRYLLNDVIKNVKNDKTPSEINAMLINQINSDATTWKISKNDFIEKLGSLSTSRGIKKSLLIIDVICKNISGIINVEKINLEHIYPQSPKPEWARNGWPSHREEQKPLIDNIGNYLLLNEKINKSIQNKYINDKVDKYKQVISRDLVLQTPMNTVDFDRFEREQQHYIDQRKEEIANMIQSDLPFGRVLIKNE